MGDRFPGAHLDTTTIGNVFGGAHAPPRVVSDARVADIREWVQGAEPRTRGHEATLGEMTDRSQP